MNKTLDDYLNALSSEDRKKVDKRAAEIIAEEMSLRELRKARNQSQQALSQKLRVGQSEISKIEHRTDIYLSTLRDYVKAMGGSLEIIASFPDSNPIRIAQFEELDDSREVLEA